jgi:hypothetical protein|tara:strand:+ start:71 stop:379 length:309 start_codon:yes stop_codon:yes gene_type:complete
MEGHKMTVQKENQTIQNEILRSTIEYMEKQCVNNIGDTYRKIVELDFGCEERRILDELYRVLLASFKDSDELVDITLNLPMYNPSSLSYVQYDANHNRIDRN